MKRKFVGIEPDLLVGSKVALVGNSPKTLNEKRGSEIDEHDEVIRFNGALAEGYEPHVGSKTTIEVIGIDMACLFAKPYHRPCVDPETKRVDESKNARIRRLNCELLLQTFPNAKIVTFSPHNKERIKANKQYDTANVLRDIDANREIFYFSETGKGTVNAYYQANRELEEFPIENKLSFSGPRTGFKMVLKLILSGIVPDLYGFDVDPSLKVAKHYYDNCINEDIEKYKSHDIKGEIILLNELHDKGYVNIVS